MAEACPPDVAQECRQIADPSPESMYRRNLRTGRCVYTGSAAQAVLGVLQDEMPGETLEQTMEHVHPDDRLAVRKWLRRLIQEGSGVMTSEFRVLRRDTNECAWVRHTAEIQCDENGSPCVLSGTVQGMGATKDPESQLFELQLRYANLRKTAKVALCQTRIDGRSLVTCNEKMAGLLGYETAEECLERFVPVDAYVDPCCSGRFVEALAERWALDNVEVEIKRADCTTVWLRYSMSGHGDGQVADVVAVDITARRLLSPSEMEVLNLLMAGLNNKEIAQQRSRSLRTIEHHRASIMSRLGVRTSFELARRVMDSQLD